MFSTVIFVSGNDGSGKSTFLKLQYSSEDQVYLEKYYKSWLRSKFRRAIAFFISIKKIKYSKKKLASPKNNNTKIKVPIDRSVIGYFFWVFVFFPYQLLRIIEIKIKQSQLNGKTLVFDRCFIDEIASIETGVKMRCPSWIVKCIDKMMGAETIYYLFAGHEIEFSRIKEEDQSAEFHLRKEKVYLRLIKILETKGSNIKRVNTAGKND